MRRPFSQWLWGQTSQHRVPARHPPEEYLETLMTQQQLRLLLLAMRLQMILLLTEAVLSCLSHLVSLEYRQKRRALSVCVPFPRLAFVSMLLT